jgi:amino acid transporter
MSLDFGVLLGGFCVFDMSFHQNLLTSTSLLLLSVFLIITISHWLHRRHENFYRGSSRAKFKHADRGVFVAVYLLLFAYPVLSVKISSVFACHEVAGIRYLEADYSIRCADVADRHGKGTHEWNNLRALAIPWACGYVVAFPIFVLYKLHALSRAPVNPSSRYPSRATSASSRAKSSRTPSRGCLSSLDLHFLLADYKSNAHQGGVCSYWEGVEMVLLTDCTINRLYY